MQKRTEQRKFKSIDNLKQRYFFVLVILIPFLGNAQSITELPKLLPSYSEDFSDYKSYPSMCFEDVFIDEQGKMWLQTCGTATLAGLHLFQFDGYDFRLVQGALKQLNFNAQVNGFYKGQKLVGHMHENDQGSIFMYDIQKDQLQFYEIPEKGRINTLLRTASG